jgi:hypothetical protein
VVPERLRSALSNGINQIDGSAVSEARRAVFDSIAPKRSARSFQILRDIPK